MIFMLMPLVAAFAQDVVGKWKLEDGSAIVEVYKSGDAYNGKIVWLQNPTEADGTPAVDSLNPDASLRKRQLIGLNMLSGLKKNGGEYTERHYDGFLKKSRIGGVALPQSAHSRRIADIGPAEIRFSILANKDSILSLIWVV